jgi:hypothetical protein
MRVRGGLATWGYGKTWWKVGVSVAGFVNIGVGLV